MEVAVIHVSTNLVHFNVNVEMDSNSDLTARLAQVVRTFSLTISYHINEGFIALFTMGLQPFANIYLRKSN